MISTGLLTVLHALSVLAAAAVLLLLGIDFVRGLFRREPPQT